MILIGLIIAALFFVTSIFFLNNTKGILNKEESIQGIQQWVLKESFQRKLSTASFPPFVGLGDPIKIKSDSDFKSLNGKPERIKEEIAIAMVDCWRAFYRGNENFMNEGDPPFCYPCQKIEFSKDIKESHKLQGLNEYLRSHKIASGKNTKTFAQYLLNKRPDLIGVQLSPEKDILSLDNDLYIYFIAMYPKNWAEKLQSISLGVASGAALIAFAPGFGTVGAIAAIGGGAYAGSEIESRLETNEIKSFIGLDSEEKDWAPQIIIDTPQNIEKLCEE